MCIRDRTKAVGRAIEQRDNVKECVFISKEEAIESFEEKYEGDELFQKMCIRDSYKEAQMAIEVGKVFDTEKYVISYENLGIGRLIYQLSLIHI